MKQKIFLFIILFLTAHAGFVFAGPVVEISGLTGWKLQPENTTFDTKNSRSYGLGFSFGYSFYNNPFIIVDGFAGYKGIKYNEYLSDGSLVKSDGDIKEAGIRSLFYLSDYFIHLGIDFGFASIRLNPARNYGSSTLFYSYMFGFNYKSFFLSFKTSTYSLDNSAILDGGQISFSTYL